MGKIANPTLADVEKAWTVQRKCHLANEFLEHALFKGRKAIERSHRDLEHYGPQQPWAEDVLDRYRPETEDDAHTFLAWQRRAAVDDAHRVLYWNRRANAMLFLESARESGPDPQQVRDAHALLDRYGPEQLAHARQVIDQYSAENKANWCALLDRMKPRRRVKTSPSVPRKV
ncbi:hypothetical protein GS489_33445 [Rhodococcus hoagii]|nr:hypothetical protein [Prescottella equi]